MDISESAIDFIKSYEELRLKAYDAGEGTGTLTIGYGHYDKSIRFGQEITEDEAEQLLRTDLNRFVDAVNDAVTGDIDQNKFDALVSLAFNAGQGIFVSGTKSYDGVLVGNVNDGSVASAAHDIASYRKSGGDVLGGLVARRNDEIDLFHKGDYRRDYNYSDHISELQKDAGPLKITGTSGPDVLWGNGLKNTVVGGAEDDILIGGPGADIYSYAIGEGHDRIADFGGRAETDVLEIRGIAAENSFNYQHRSLADEGEALRIALLNYQGRETGSVVVENMADVESQVEEVRLLDTKGKVIGRDQNLVDEFSQLENNEAPLVQGNGGSQQVAYGSQQSVRDWWAATDADAGDRAEWWAFYDANPDVNSGDFVIGGRFLYYEDGAWQLGQSGSAPSGRWVLATADQKQRNAVHFQGGEDENAEDWVFAAAHDGEAWSNYVAVLAETFIA